MFQSAHSAKTSKVVYKREGLFHKLRDPSDKCVKLKEKITKKFKNSFATSLGPSDRMSIKPVKLEINSSKVRIVADFRQLNKALKRPHWPTESSCQLLRHFCPKSRYYVTVDATSDYHQVPVAEESQPYLFIITQHGKFA